MKRWLTKKHHCVLNNCKVQTLGALDYTTDSL